jgi:hypothetical protein
MAFVSKMLSKIDFNQSITDARPTQSKLRSKGVKEADQDVPESPVGKDSVPETLSSDGEDAMELMKDVFKVKRTFIMDKKLSTLPRGATFGEGPGKTKMTKTSKQTSAMNSEGELEEEDDESEESEASWSSSFATESESRKSAKQPEMEDSDSDAQVIKKQAKQQVAQDVLNRFIENSMVMKTIPMPIFQRIDLQKRLILVNQHIDQSNYEAFLKQLPLVIPKNIKKLYLVNNNLNDKNLSDLFGALE